jgi:hypothetical protein
MENKQTAVEWLREQYDNNPESFITEDEFEKALQMEKEQIKDAYNSDRDLVSRIIDGSASEDYYNETYGGNK